MSAPKVAAHYRRLLDGSVRAVTVHAKVQHHNRIAVKSCGECRFWTDRSREYRLAGAK